MEAGRAPSPCSEGIWQEEEEGEPEAARFQSTLSYVGTFCRRAQGARPRDRGIQRPAPRRGSRDNLSCVLKARPGTEDK